MTQPAISFIVPAYNEEALLPRTLATLFASARAVNEPFEVIVVNDASTDRTAEIAQACGARVVDVHRRQIAAVRNAGACEAKGSIFIFVDADTLLPEATLRDALSALKNGAGGGGARVDFDLKTWKLHLGIVLFTFFWFTLARWAAGCFIFVRREAFEKAGGFNEQYFVGEELFLSRALKRVAPFRILKSRVISSGRKARTFTPGQILRTALRLFWQGPKAWRRREGLEMWYDGRRETSRP